MTEKHIIYGYRCRIDGGNKDKWYVGITTKRNKYNRHICHKSSNSDFHSVVYAMSFMDFSFEKAFEYRLLWEGECGTHKAAGIESVFIKKYNLLTPNGFNDRDTEYCGRSCINEDKILKEILENHFTIPQAATALGYERQGRVTWLVKLGQLSYMENNQNYPPLVPKVDVKRSLMIRKYKASGVVIGKEQDGVCHLWSSEDCALKYIGGGNVLESAKKEGKIKSCSLGSLNTKSVFDIPSIMAYKKEVKSLFSIEEVSKMLGIDYKTTARRISDGEIQFKK